jgi:C4-type Zn-finger protein
MEKKRRHSTTIRVNQDAINNCTSIALKLGDPYNYSSVVEQAMLLITPEQIIENLKKQNNEKTNSIKKKG